LKKAESFDFIDFGCPSNNTSHKAIWKAPAQFFQQTTDYTRGGQTFQWGPHCSVSTQGKASFYKLYLYKKDG